MIRDQIVRLLEQAILRAQAQGLLPSSALPEIVLERPPSPSFGDYACPLPLKLARGARMAPAALGQALVELLPPLEGMAQVAVAPSGFINFTLAGPWLARQVDEIVKAGPTFGALDLGGGARLQLEFVSVNPTGPMHVGHGRGAILGSTLARVLASAGYQVATEYYINDAGSQMDAFYRSVYVRYLQALGREAEFQPGGYLGNYVVDLAQDLAAEVGAGYLDLPQEEALARIGPWALERMLRSIKDDLALLGVSFDVWFSEQSLFAGGQYDRAIKMLAEGGFTAEGEGALWFVSTALGEEKDNVLVRASGAPTYFASDAAYHYNKFLERKFDRVINIWGADHQGHVTRMKAVVAALGVAPDRLQVILTQMVTLRRGQEVLRISKRTGDLITLREVAEEVGADACRFFFLARSPESQMDFDLELAKRQSAENPVYYIQYAHARIAGILRLAGERGIDYSGGDVSLLAAEPELNLIRKLFQLPEVVELVARNLEPHHLSYYAQDLATAFHTFYDECRVITQEQALTHARLKLVEASRIVLAKALYLMGMAAPERM